MFFFAFKEAAELAIKLALVFRGTAVRRNISPSHVAVAICGRGGLIILMIMRRTMMAIAIDKQLFETGSLCNFHKGLRTEGEHRRRFGENL